MSWLALPRWSPYGVGAGIGVLVLISFILSNRPIGCSTAYVRASGLGEILLWGERVENNEYYKKFVPKIGWEVVLLVGVVLGALISSGLSGTLAVEKVPGLWRAEFGSSFLLRAVAAILGGFFVGFGARMAGGCTSGHGISGTLQLAASSWLALFCFFIGGFGAAYLLYAVVGGI
ncbi:MAG: YeeE/YedE thiosulfate transporter family protein [Candidatus Bipolaricaulota bacterium]|nr:YeeE/YedE family protein [Candidatus Bipolaricaulota bacterium]MBS3792047.1 YeeE/YedE family protein [Candidatus Bipolaricaulota bacterium]